MMTTYDLSPLFRSTVGFDRLSQLIDNAFKAEERASTYPPYNIIRDSDDRYRIVMAVAGFTLDDLEIVVQENALSVKGQIQAGADDENATYLHRGIANRSFERKFSLADHVKVEQAALSDGLLTLHLAREVPEASKPRKIAIEVNASGEKAKSAKNRTIEHK